MAEVMENSVPLQTISVGFSAHTVVPKVTAPPTLSPSELERLHTRRKCARCKQYYTLATAGNCNYHPGVWTEPNSVLQGVLVGWSCCHISGYDVYQPVVNQAALIEGCIGCCVADSHEEDEQYKSTMARFPFDAYSVLSTTAAATNLDSAPLNNPKRDSVDDADANALTADKNFYRHKILEGETLIGIALKYDISVSQLKRINRLGTDQIFPLKELLIPVDKAAHKSPTENPANVKALAVSTFKNKAGCSLEEATFYMESADFDVAAALKEFEQDVKWEVENKKKINQPPTKDQLKKAKKSSKSKKPEKFL